MDPTPEQLEKVKLCLETIRRYVFDEEHNLAGWRDKQEAKEAAQEITKLLDDMTQF